jgi:hypothetical protein
LTFASTAENRDVNSENWYAFPTELAYGFPQAAALPNQPPFRDH